MPSISARAKWWCQCAFLVEDPKFRVYVQKWRMRAYNEGYYWHISFKCQKPCSFSLLVCISISDLVPSINSLSLEVYSEIHFPPGLPFTHLYHQNLKKYPTYIQKPTYECIFFSFLNFKSSIKTCILQVLGGGFWLTNQLTLKHPPQNSLF